MRKTENKIFNIRKLLTNPALSGTFRGDNLATELALLQRVIAAEKQKLEVLQKGQAQNIIDITSGVDKKGRRDPATAGELEGFAERLELKFAMTQEANLKARS